MSTNGKPRAMPFASSVASPTPMSMLPPAAAAAIAAPFVNGVISTLKPGLVEQARGRARNSRRHTCRPERCRRAISPARSARATACGKQGGAGGDEPERGGARDGHVSATCRARRNASSAGPRHRAHLIHPRSMLSKDDNDRVTRTDAGTPMGEAFRRYWIPAALSSELPRADGAPIRVRLLGEDLVAFRDDDGSVGLVERVLPASPRADVLRPQRRARTALRLSRLEIRHTGACVDMPSEPPDSLFKTKVTIASLSHLGRRRHALDLHGAAATRQPPPPDYELVRVPASHRFISKTLQHCNYLQGLEGGLDSSHATIMHRDNIGDRSWLRAYESLVPRIDVERTPYGFMYTGIRQYPTEQWVRAYQYMMPAMQMRGSVAGNFSRDGHPAENRRPHLDSDGRLQLLRLQLRSTRTMRRRRSPKKPQSPRRSTSAAGPTICCPISRSSRT